MTTATTRRSLLRSAAFGLFAFEVAGVTRMLSPAEAYAQGARLKVLTPAAARTLGALGDVLLPGARDAGITAFVDSQLARSPAESLLMIRYMDMPPPHAPFYLAGLAALDGLARQRHGHGFADLAEPDQSALVGAIAKGIPDGWQGPPAPLVYFVIRADAVDVVYGTEAGFERLNLPYAAHIAPPRPW